MKKLILNIFALACVSNINADMQEIEIQPSDATRKQKINKNDEVSEHLLAIYIAAVNDLAVFADRNLSQIMKVATNSKNLKIVIHLDIKRLAQKKITQRFYVQNNTLVKIGPDLNMSSGDPNTLLDFCRMATTQFKAKRYHLLIWNHGTGDVEPQLRRAVNASELFNFNPQTRKIELDRSIGFLDFVRAVNEQTEERGSCFDDSSSTYITNKSLGQVLDTVCKECLMGEQFETIIFDACLMSMVGVATSIKQANDGKGAAKYMVASQEVVLGSGYDYFKMLSPLVNSPMQTEDFIRHIVTSYTQVYSAIIQDYTQSVIKLENFDQLEQNINRISNILVDGLNKQKNFSVKRVLKISKSKDNCTHFEEPTYIDLNHFLKNVISNINKIELSNPAETESYKQELLKELSDCCQKIREVVLHNSVGQNLKSASGISIYFPEYNVHSSFAQTDFGSKNSWHKMLIKYLSLPSVN